METIFYTLQDYMTFSKGVTYIIMGIGLIAITIFWGFLSENDDD